jgi:hypothetical protein
MMLCLLLVLSLQSGAGAATTTATKGDDVARGVQLLQAAQKAMGGADKLAAVKDTTQTAEIVMAEPFEHIKVAQSSRYIAPNEIRQEQVHSKGTTTVYSDGKSGWIGTKKGSTPLNGDGIATARGVLFRQLCTLMLSDRDRSRKVTAVGPNTVEISGSDAQKVKVEFDPKTGLPLRLSYALSSNGVEAARTETLSDWRDVNGVRLPFHSVQVDSGKKMLELNVSSYKVNSGLKPTELSRP